MESDIRFKAINRGVGFFKETPPSSYYKKPHQEDEDHLISQYTPEVFFGLGKAYLDYEELEKRLEKPILDSLQNRKREFRSQPLRKKVEKKEQSLVEQIELPSDHPLNHFQTPPLEVLSVDYGFSLGVYLIGFVMVAAAFSFSFPFSFFPSLVTLAITYCLFHQLYVVVCRSLLGVTLGEERYNLGWDYSSLSRFMVRSLLISLTGFILFPIFSAVFKRDLLRDYTGLRLRYNI